MYLGRAVLTVRPMHFLTAPIAVDTAGRTVTITWSDANASSSDSSASRPAPSAIAATPPVVEPEFDEIHEVDESRPAIVGNESVLDRLAQAFPGAERVAEPVERER